MRQTHNKSKRDYNKIKRHMTNNRIRCHNEKNTLKLYKNEQK